jgi:hypothetical protein
VGLLDRLRGNLTEAEPMVPRSELAAVSNEVEILQESLAGLESLAREDIGWRKLGMEQERTFTRAGLLQIQTNCLAAAIKSPLIGRGLRIRRNYVWGEGVEIAARVDPDGDTKVNDHVQAFLDSADFQRILGSAQAREERELNLGTAGEFFLLAINDGAGRVTPRLVPGAQVTDYIANPDDPTEIWFYRRDWTVTGINLANGQKVTQTRTEWHPTLDYRPPAGERLDLIGMKPIRWDQPIQHCAVNSWTEAPWGLSDSYAAIDWARGYADYLNGWAGLMQALARYAFKATAPAKHAPKVRDALNRGQAGLDPVSGERRDVGGTVVMSSEGSMAPMHSSGATIDSGSGKPLAGMVAAALDVPLTMLLADPGSSGARAVAETLDKPLELTTKARQSVWGDWLRDLLRHVILVAVDAGVLQGAIVQDGNRQRADLAGDSDGTIDINFPPIEDTDPQKVLEALVAADGLGVPLHLIIRLALEALGVEDIDELIDDMTDERGNFIDPRIVAAANAAQREQDGGAGSQAQEAYR